MRATTSTRQVAFYLTNFQSKPQSKPHEHPAPFPSEWTTGNQNKPTWDTLVHERIRCPQGTAEDFYRIGEKGAQFTICVSWLTM